MGLYSRGLEANHFVECDSAGGDARAWPVRIDSAQAARFKAEDSAPGAFHDAVYLVVWRASYHVTPPASPPRMAPPGPRWLEVSEVLSVRAPGAGECGYSPPRP